MAFTPKAGCPMCGIVATASHAAPNSPRSPSFPAGSTQPEVLWRDDNFTCYREKANPVSSRGHVVIVFNLHVPSLYTLSSSDLPLLATVKSLAIQLLTSITNPASPAQMPVSATFSTPLQVDHSTFRIGFVTPPFKDNKIPVTDHLHAHAYIAPADLAGWWRGIAYSSVAWYAIDDLVAEIREETSNNRVRSGNTNRPGRSKRPIEMVPDAGARAGTADGREITDAGIAVTDPESGELLNPTSPQSLSPDSLAPQSQIPVLQLQT
ncbi:hypothetical protein OE88DRAFT_1709727 [Heliocybe sulcata]|uniref:HIT domain-containing protein n=1 Tax=Heliocybe sulcata TaxID=5364 RepID=A0A5C3NLX9_9AGAM|nr:hypothetical protein OE88DRAFT_1709727 [Heliocybe sulcata]